MELPFTLDRAAPGLATTLARELRAAIRAGTLGAGRRLPPSRALAADLGVSRGVVPNLDLGYPDPAGSAALRAALADYLVRVRGAVAGPRDLVITSGVGQALALIGQSRPRALIAAIGRHLPLLRVRGVSAGLHLYAELPPGADGAAITAAAARRGVAVDAVAATAVGSRPGLLLGYAALSGPALRQAAVLLSVAMADAHVTSA